MSNAEWRGEKGIDNGADEDEGEGESVGVVTWTEHSTRHTRMQEKQEYHAEGTQGKRRCASEGH